MATGDEFVNLSLKRFLSQNRLNENLLEYLQENGYDGLSRIFPSAGLFTHPVAITPAATGNVFTLSPDPIEGTDGEGHIISLAGTRLVDIPFENITSNLYWIGLKYIEIPSGVYDNPRIGVPEYDKTTEEVGEKAEPVDVTDLTGTIRFNCDSIFENGVDHSGREVTVWLKNPVSSDADVALETIAVIYDAGSGENRITTLYTLGQGTVSTTNLDYYIACLGCTVIENATNPFTDEYIQLGSILGDSVGTPTTTTTAYQLDLSGGGGHTLQNAYDGLAGSGSGKNILAADEAVHITQYNPTLAASDIYHASLRLTTDSDKTGWTSSVTIPDLETGIDIKSRFYSQSALVNRKNIGDFTVNAFLNAEETITVVANGAVITFSRVGVDLNFAGLFADLHPGAELEVCEITGSANGNDGVYYINALTGAPTSTLTLDNLDGTAAALILETGTAGLAVSIYRLTTQIGKDFDSFTLITTGDFQRDVVGSSTAFKIISPSGSSDSKMVAAFERMDAAGTTVVDYVRAYANGDLKISGAFTVVGNITSTTGDITATAGGVTAGAALAAGTTVTAGTGITATTGHITASTGNIVASVGDVKAQEYVVADNNGDGTGEFQYGAARTRYSYLLPEEFAMAEAGSWRVSPGDEVGGSQEYSILVGTGPDDTAIAPIHLPDGCSFTGIEILCLSNYPSNSNQMSLEVLKTTHTWGVTPAINARTKIGNTMATTDTTGLVIEELSQTFGTPETIDNENNAYAFHVISGQVSDHIYLVRLTYKVTILSTC